MALKDRFASAVKMAERRQASLPVYPRDFAQQLSLSPDSRDDDLGARIHDADDATFLRYVADRVFHTCSPDENGMDQGHHDRLLEIANRVSPVEMRLCEQGFVVLRPDVAYIFTVDPTCEKCKQLAANYAKEP